ncbi:G-PROTEIN-RECEP-F1-2 domain-containing protein [Aphelenchoides fujianensis]|nr:G-PROTEIN-RECEP-F1-2 domain-containing protein [Aphelenchoides fujianensis]
MNDTYGPLGWSNVLTASGRAALRETASSPTCVNATLQPLTVGHTDYYVQHYVFPAQFVAGVAGNCINLIVLLSSGMKNQANILLSAMAFADLAFLVCLLPFSLASFEFFFSSQLFAFVFHKYKTNFIALANTFSIAASWLVLAVSIERFSGVRRPMHARFQVRERRLMALISSIFLCAFHDHLLASRGVLGCHLRSLRDRPPALHAGRHYLSIARFFQSVAGVLLPVTAVAILNVSLIYFLRKREILPRTVNDSKQPEFRFVRYSDIGPLQRQGKRKVTATVLAIVTCFSVSHLPTLGPFIWEHFYPSAAAGSTLHYNTITLLNTLLISGKVLNFVLFCLSSAHFRRRTAVILSARLCGNAKRKKFASLATQNTTDNTANLSNAGSFHQSIALHHTDSAETSLHQLQRSFTPSTSSGHTPRAAGQRFQKQHSGGAPPSPLLREDSLDLPCCSSSSGVNSGPPTLRSQDRDSQKGRRIFGIELNEIGRSLRKSKGTYFFPLESMNTLSAPPIRAFVEGANLQQTSE